MDRAGLGKSGKEKFPALWVKILGNPKIGNVYREGDWKRKRGRKEIEVSAKPHIIICKMPEKSKEDQRVKRKSWKWRRSEQRGEGTETYHPRTELSVVEPKDSPAHCRVGWGEGCSLPREECNREAVCSAYLQIIYKRWLPGSLPLHLHSLWVECW